MNRTGLAIATLAVGAWMMAMEGLSIGSLAATTQETQP